MRQGLSKLLRRHVEALAQRRGYTLEAVQGCLVEPTEDGGGWWYVDPQHPAFPRARGDEPPPPTPPVQACGSCGDQTNIAEVKASPEAQERLLRGE